MKSSREIYTESLPGKITQEGESVSGEKDDSAAASMIPNMVETGSSGSRSSNMINSIRGSPPLSTSASSSVSEKEWIKLRYPLMWLLVLVLGLGCMVKVSLSNKVKLRGKRYNKKQSV